MGSRHAASCARGTRKLTQETMTQVRLVVGDHVFMTKHSHKTVLEHWGIMHPVQDLQNRMVIEELQDDQLDPFTGGKHSNWWTHVQHTLTIPDVSALTPIIPSPSHTSGVPCPTCGVCFLNRTAMLLHMSKRHKDDPPRPHNQHVTFNKARDAKSGLHICRHCDKTMWDWSSLRKHIQEKRCSKLFGHAGNDVPANASDVDADLVLGQAARPSSVNLPSAQRPYVLRYGDNAAFHLPDRHVLTHHCALCHQWITEPGKMKQHYCLSHTRTYEQYLHPAANLCSMSTAELLRRHRGSIQPCARALQGWMWTCRSASAPHYRTTANQ